MRNYLQPIVLLLFALTVVNSPVQGQDPRFSQYYASPWNLNPAMSSVFNGSWRTTLNYREQWSSILSPNPFRTYSVAGEYRRALASDDYVGFGLGVMRDEVGTARFTQSKVHGGFSFLKQLAGGRYRNDQYLAAGAQIGFGQNALDWSRLWFSRQYDPTNESPDFNASSGEASTLGNTPLFFDFNAGLLYYVVFENDGFFYAGATGHHLNNPVISLYEGGNETQYRRWSGHLGAQLPTTDYFSLLPAVQFMKQGPSMETDLGMNIRYSNNDLNEVALRAGVWGRVGNKYQKTIGMDALTFVAMLELNRWMLGLSYDVTVSSLTRANNSRGAFEVSLTYVQPGQNRRSRVICPKF